MSARCENSEVKGNELPEFQENYWYIHGKVYDMTPFLKYHPGGETMLRLGQGRDCSVLFDSYHSFSDKPKEILESYLVSNVLCPPPMAKHAAKDPLYAELKQMVRNYKQGNGSVKIKPAHFVFSLIMLVGLVLCYYRCLVFGHHLDAIFVGLFQMLLGLQLTHDGLHGAVSSTSWLNMLAGWASLPFVYSPIPWLIQHDVQHHVYTNEITDIDLHYLTPYLRVTPLLRYSFWNAVNLFWVFVEAIFASMNLAFFVPMKVLFKPKRYYPQAKNKHLIINPVFGTFLGQTAFTLLCWGAIVYFQGFWFSMEIWTITGFYFIIITQVSHLQESCHVIDESLPWSVQQIDRAVDYNVYSRFWNIVSGGLNAQSLHHLFPTVHNSHYPDLYAEYVRICTKHGVIVKHTSATNVMSDYFKWIHKLSYNY